MGEDYLKHHLPRQGQGLQDTEDEREPLVMPLQEKGAVTALSVTRGTSQKGSRKLKHMLTQKAEHRVSAKHN